MNDIVNVTNIADYNRILGAETLHPLVSVTDFASLRTLPHCRKNFGFYAIFYKELECGTLLYGRSKYDYEDGTLVFISPGQIAGTNDGGETPNPRGLVLMFHPDFLHGTSLARRMGDYSFFGYESNEALHMSDREKQLILQCFHDIQEELSHPFDKHTKRIVASYIETLLNHCMRFYDRQFSTRQAANKDQLSQFEHVLRQYFESDQPIETGLPSVQYCADRMHLSPNYFGDLVKKETGRTAQEYIQLATISRAKDLLLATGSTVSEIAYQLGFKYPHHLSRVFKKVVGVSPLEYRAQAV